MPTYTKIKGKANGEQLERLQAEVEALRKQLREAHQLATVGTLTAIVAHEFNNILTPIINYAKMAQSNPALIDKALSHATNGGNRAAKICRSLLDATSNDRNDRQTIYLAELVNETLDVMARAPDKDAITLNLNFPDDLKITTRPAELQQVLLNLLINAREAVLNKSGPRRIAVSAVVEDKHIIIRLADNGVGIVGENLEKIFQPFFSTKSKGPDRPTGYGLGLAFCRNAMSILGGDISVESTPGEGTTFTLRLPA